MKIIKKFKFKKYELQTTINFHIKRMDIGIQNKDV